MNLDAEHVKKSLNSINKKTLPGLRDYALLSLALTTGRRASELAGLQWKHIRMERKKMRITWEHCKGDKQMIDEIKPQTQKALLAYLSQLHGGNLLSLAPDQPVFVSFSKNNYGGQISIQTVSDICKDRLGTSKVHATRHTFAIGMEEAGATLSDIGARLGHANLKTTSDYMQRLHSAENKYASELEKMFGI
jgi:integrase